MKRELCIKLFIAIGFIVLIAGAMTHQVYIFGIGGLILALAGSKL